MNLDLNLLLTLDALLTEQSVTAAARRLGRTQPAVSQALGRLRTAFEDPLLVRVGRGLVPTARGAALAPEVRRLLAELEALVHRDAAFDPARSTRRFRLACPDLLAPLLPRVLGPLQAEAPGVVLAVEPPLRDPLADALAAPDAPLALLPTPEDLPDVRFRRMGVVTWGLLVRRGHPLTDGVVDVARWLAWPHVLVRTGAASRNRVADALTAAGLERRVGIELPSFLMVPDALGATDLVHVAPRELVGPLLDRHALVLLPLPVALPPLPVGVAWHARHHGDPGHRWLREHVSAALAAFLAAPT